MWPKPVIISRELAHCEIIPRFNRNSHYFQIVLNENIVFSLGWNIIIVNNPLLRVSWYVRGPFKGYATPNLY